MKVDYSNSSPRVIIMHGKLSATAPAGRGEPDHEDALSSSFHGFFPPLPLELGRRSATCFSRERLFSSVSFKRGIIVQPHSTFHFNTFTERKTFISPNTLTIHNQNLESRATEEAAREGREIYRGGSFLIESGKIGAIKHFSRHRSVEGWHGDAEKIAEEGGGRGGAHRRA